MAPPRVVTVAIAALLTLVFALAGCSVERSLDGDDLADQIQAQLFPQYPALVSAVDCPALLEPAVGNQLSCGVQLGSQIIDISVELVGTEDDLQAQAIVDERFVEASQLSELLAATLSAEVGIATRVDCGQPIVVLDPGEALVCTAVDPEGVNRQFDVRIDETGSVAIEIR